jgi:prepilin-type N-terminal cleavage/methylation domain-containing protein
MNRITNKKGFSFMEVMVSIFVLSVGITAVLFLMVKNIKSSIDSRNSIIASELAQEGVELIRNIRDNNMANAEEDVFESLSYPLNPMIFKIDYNPNSISGGSISWFSNSNPGKLYYNNSGYYSNSGGVETRFARIIKIEKVGVDEDMLKVSSYVTWDGATDRDRWVKIARDASVPCTIANKCVYAEDILTDWGSQ